MEVSLNEIGEIITGNTPSKSDTNFWNSPDICFIKPDVIAEDEITELLNSNEYISENARNKARIVNENSILVTCIGSIAKIGIVKIRECAFNQQINAIIPNKNIDTKYLCYCLQNSKVKLKAIANAPVVPIINKKQFGEFVVNIDGDISTQKKIVNRLDYTQSVITLYKIQLQKFEDLIKARFIEMFGDLKSNEKGWDLKTFEEMSVLITDGEHSTPKRTKEGIYLLSARNVLNHSLQLKDVDYINRDEYLRIAKRVVPKKGDILISCSGTIGRCCCVPDSLQLQMVRSVALIRFKEVINPIFAEYMITSDYLQEQINSSKTMSSQANLFQGKIRKLKGFLPPTELQQQFADFVKQVDKLKFEMEKSLNELENNLELYKEKMTKYTYTFEKENDKYLLVSYKYKR